VLATLAGALSAILVREYGDVHGDADDLEDGCFKKSIGGSRCALPHATEAALSRSSSPHLLHLLHIDEHDMMVSLEHKTVSLAPSACPAHSHDLAFEQLLSQFTRGGPLTAMLCEG
jgi:hypothetical protein